MSPERGFLSERKGKVIPCWWTENRKRRGNLQWTVWCEESGGWEYQKRKTHVKDWMTSTHKRTLSERHTEYNNTNTMCGCTRLHAFRHDLSLSLSLSHTHTHTHTHTSSPSLSPLFCHIYIFSDIWQNQIKTTSWLKFQTFRRLPSSEGYFL